MSGSTCMFHCAETLNLFEFFIHKHQSFFSFLFFLFFSGNSGKPDWDTNVLHLHHACILYSNEQTGNWLIEPAGYSVI